MQYLKSSYISFRHSSLSPGPVRQFQGVEGLDHNNIAGVQLQDSNNADTEMVDLTAATAAGETTGEPS